MNGPLAFSTSLAGHTKPQNALCQSTKPADLKTLTFRQKSGRVNRKVAIGVEEKWTKLEKNRIYFCELIVTKSFLEFTIFRI